MVALAVTVGFAGQKGGTHTTAGRVVADPPAAGAPSPALQAEVLGLVDFPWQERLTGWTVRFRGPREGYLGATWPQRREIELYVGPGQSAHEVAVTLAHEIGHAIDLTVFDDAARDAWLAARGASGADWWAASGAEDYVTGAGDWAECFAQWLVGGRNLSRLAEPADAAQLALVARFARG